MLEDGNVFGFNIGYGFGNTSAASENMLFYNGKSHKLEDVKFNIPMDGKNIFIPSLGLSLLLTGVLKWILSRL